MNTVKNIYSATAEYSPMIVDRFGRAPSCLSKNNVLDPVLSEYLFKAGFTPTYKNDKKYAICFSHDIDFIYERKNKNVFFISLLQSIKNKKMAKASYDFKNLFKPHVNPNWILDRVIDIEHKHNISSTYFFLSLKQGEEDFNYSIESQKKYFDVIEKEGGEIGLHGGHEAYKSLSKINEEKNNLENALGKTVTGYRNHYLRFKTPDTWAYLDKLKFSYDSTFGIPETIGYRNGLCYPFRPYDISSNDFYELLEIPLIVMDVTFFKYMNLNVENAWVLFNKILNDVKSVKGVLTIVWHNNCLDGEYGVLYNKIIEKLANDEEAWITNSRDLTTWWKDNNMAKMEDIILSEFDKEIV